MTERKKVTGFMPPRFRFNAAPSSYSLKLLEREPKLALEKIWAEQERQKSKLHSVPENSDIPELGDEAA